METGSKGLFVCEILFIEGFKLLQWLALLSKQALSLNDLLG